MLMQIRVKLETQYHTAGITKCDDFGRLRETKQAGSSAASPGPLLLTSVSRVLVGLQRETSRVKEHQSLGDRASATIERSERFLKRPLTDMSVSGVAGLHRWCHPPLLQ